MNENPDHFLIDSNSLIEPYERYYPFDFAQNFWDQLKLRIEDGSILILDVVKDEIEKGDDELSHWIDGIQIPSVIDHREDDIVKHYRDVLIHLQKDPCFSNKALTEWSQNNVADPWLIATAITYKCTITTFEKPVGGLNSKSPCKHPKIPDVSVFFHVKTNNLFDIMRIFSFHI